MGTRLPTRMSELASDQVRAELTRAQARETIRALHFQSVIASDNGDDEDSQALWDLHQRLVRNRRKSGGVQITVTEHESERIRSALRARRLIHGDEGHFQKADVADRARQKFFPK